LLFDPSAPPPPHSLSPLEGQIGAGLAGYGGRRIGDINNKNNEE
jgi:hypothetical protein